ncbi:MAG: DUF4129 domain-containing protein [Chloroflexi bacterium]|nr:DUF4129 domain-containing protein [Chloroflexota bacterium]
MRRWALNLTFLGMEATWLYVAVAVFYRLVGFESSPTPLFFTTLVVSFCVARFLTHLDLPPRMVQVLALGVAFFFLLTILHGELLGIWALPNLSWAAQFLGRATDVSRGLSPFAFTALLGLGLWWRGTGLAHQKISLQRYLVSFARGMGVIAAGILLLHWLAPEQRAWSALLLFFALGLTGATLANMESIAAPFSRRGMYIVIPLVGGILFFGSLLALFGGVDVWSLLSVPLNIVAWVVDRILLIVFLALGYVAEGIIIILSLLMRFLPRQEAQSQEEASPQWVEELRKAGQGGSAISEPLLQALRLLVLAMVLGLIAWWLIRALRRRGREERDDETAIRESIPGAKTIGLDALLRDLFSLRKGGERAHSWRTFGDGNVARVYRLYLRFLASAAERGLERKLTETPGEFQEPASRLFSPPAVAHLTSAFQRARYGLIPPDEEEMAHLLRDWPP